MKRFVLILLFGWLSRNMALANNGCTNLDVLMYHHIQPMDEAIIKRQKALTVTPEYFNKDLEYLKIHDYNVISAKQLSDYFGGGSLPEKAVLLTFDDAYSDLYDQMWPILKDYGYQAIIFTPTGLVGNPDYLSWKEMEEMKNGGIYFGNHTWSHFSGIGTEEIIRKEISLADKQLEEKGQNNLKFFAYPYGTINKKITNVLTSLNYKIAFTTKKGYRACLNKSLEIPRIRIGNRDLKVYGL